MPGESTELEWEQEKEFMQFASTFTGLFRCHLCSKWSITCSCCESLLSPKYVVLSYVSASSFPFLNMSEAELLKFQSWKPKPTTTLHSQSTQTTLSVMPNRVEVACPYFLPKVCHSSPETTISYTKHHQIWPDVVITCPFSISTLLALLPKLHCHSYMIHFYIVPRTSFIIHLSWCPYLFLLFPPRQSYKTCEL